ncbi:MAG: hypothetical protein WDO24_21335 [Pseudomonadota bacterium]
MPVLTCIFSWSSTELTAETGVRIASGAGQFVFVDQDGDPSRPITVYSYLPKQAKANEAPIAFILHGHHRSAKAYRDDWAKHADKYGFMVIAPLFDAASWGEGDYSYRSVVDKNGRPTDPSRWSYSVIEHLFDAIKLATANPNPRYLLYGFSEGGQFVHRLVLFLPEARYSRAVAGTPGWYSMPVFDVRFPYGLRDSPATRASLKLSLERDVVLILGESDTDPKGQDVRQTSQALAQGAGRFERGQNFYLTAKKSAAELDARFGWRLKIVAGAAHEPRKMSPAAAEILMAR